MTPFRPLSSARPTSRPANRQDRRSQAWRTGAVGVIAGSLALGVVGAGVLGAGVAGAKKKPSGTVVLLSAGSLSTLIATSLDAAFHSATGYTITDIHHGSTALAQGIKSGEYQGDVFWSATPSADKAIQGATNGGWVKWYIKFATSQLVLGYNPKSSFASTIVNNPWWKVIDKPGFLIGRTNPVTDPKGRLAVAALQTAATTYKAPTLAAIATKQTTIFTETTLVGRLQAGQLDAGFFYAVEASAAHLTTVPLAGVTEHATYTLTILSKAPHVAAAEALVKYILSGPGKKVLKQEGLTEVTPVLYGSASSVPKPLKKVIP